MNDSLDAEYFDALYASNPDPWNFATSPYEAEKYAKTIAALGNERFERGLEIGCSIGVLSALLAERCRELVSVDINARALAAARLRCADHRNVSFRELSAPRELPDGPFDLVVLSEVGYYWSDADLALARNRIAAFGSGTTVLLVHFLPKVDDYKRDGDAVHTAFLEDHRYVCERSSRAERYRIDVLRLR